MSPQSTQNSGHGTARGPRWTFDQSEMAGRFAALRAIWASTCEVQVGAETRGLAWIDLEGGDLQPLSQAVAERAAWLGTSDLRIAASGFVFAYARALVMPAVLGLTAIEAIPVLRTDNARVAFVGPHRGVLNLQSPQSVAIDPTIAAGQSTDFVADRRELVQTLVDHAVGQHLGLLVERVTEAFRIASRVLRANIAYEISLEFADPVLADRPVEPRLRDALAFHELASIYLGTTGSLEAERTRRRLKLRFERVNCCLTRLVPGRTTCDGCSDASLSARVASPRPPRVA